MILSGLKIITLSYNLDFKQLIKKSLKNETSNFIYKWDLYGQHFVW